MEPPLRPCKDLLLPVSRVPAEVNPWIWALEQRYDLYAVSSSPADQFGLAKRPRRCPISEVCQTIKTVLRARLEREAL